MQRILFVVIIILPAVVSTHDLGSQKPKPSTPAYSADDISENAAVSAPRESIRFSGEVSKGLKFETEIGENLFFRLNPHELGWMISVGSKTSAENNFCGVVTPPYRGINHIYIEGWHFRNADNTGPNEAGPKNVNAPQEIREFNFVLDDADYRKAFDALRKLLWSYSYSKREVEEARRVHEKLTKGRGTLTIRDLKLNNLEAGKQAGIDLMRFDLELVLP